MNAQVVDGTQFPPLLKEFEKKQYIVTLIPSGVNIRNSCNVYQATKLIQPAEMGENSNCVEELSPRMEYNSVATVSKIHQKLCFVIR